MATKMKCLKYDSAPQRAATCKPVNTNNQKTVCSWLINKNANG